MRCQPYLASCMSRKMPKAQMDTVLIANYCQGAKQTLRCIDLLK